MVVVADVPEKVERWTSGRRVALVFSSLKDETSVQEAPRKHAPRVAEIENWSCGFRPLGTAGVSQASHTSFSRCCRCTMTLAGTSSSISVTSWPMIRRSFPQSGQGRSASGTEMTRSTRFKDAGKGFREGRFGGGFVVSVAWRCRSCSTISRSPVAGLGVSGGLSAFSAASSLASPRATSAAPARPSR